MLICLYDNPLLHVDIKFITIEEFGDRIENPVIVFDRDKSLQKIMERTKAEWPELNYQWIEDRFWTWVHYATLKLGRGENFEALDFLSFMRTTVISPMLQVANGNLPRGLRKVEFNFPPEDLQRLISTVPQYNSGSLFLCLENIVKLYQELRPQLFPASIRLKAETERKTLAYLREVKLKKSGDPL